MQFGLAYCKAECQVDKSHDVDIIDLKHSLPYACQVVSIFSLKDLLKQTEFECIS